jgi:RHS repeat-associated protein
VDYTGLGSGGTCGTGVPPVAHTYHYLHDALGSVVGLVDEGNLEGQGSEWRAPRVVERFTLDVPAAKRHRSSCDRRAVPDARQGYTYDPYGKVFIERWDPQADEGNGAYLPVVEQHTSGSNTVSSGLPYSHYGNPFLWTGQRYDAAVGLYAFKFRTYSPTLGRWLQRDPLGYGNGVNLFEYAMSRPKYWVDPLGLDVWIEGPGGNEPSGHLGLAIGDHNAEYVTFSFGVDMDDMWSWFGLRGVVYEEDKKDQGGEIDPKHYRKTTREQDKRLVDQLRKNLGKPGPYRVANRNCRTFSYSVFDEIARLAYGEPVSPPPREPKAASDEGGTGISSTSGSTKDGTTKTSEASGGTPASSSSSSTTSSTTSSGATSSGAGGAGASAAGAGGAGTMRAGSTAAGASSTSLTDPSSGTLRKR